MAGISHPRLVFVTGAGSGIGRATALRFAAAGAQIVPTDINAAAAAQTAALIQERGGTAHPHHLDVTDPDAWESLADTVRELYGVPDVVVNNAGLGLVGGFLDQTLEDWQRVIDVDLWGVIHGCRVFGRMMAEQGELVGGRRGHIVNIASMAAYSPGGVLAPYCTAKAGVKMLSETLRIELAPYRIGVTAICPGAIATGIVRNGGLLGAEGIENFDKYHAVIARYVEDYGPKLGFGPDHVAKAIERSVRHNWAIVPVRPEAWLAYGLSRLSPGLFRAAGQLGSGQVAALLLTVLRAGARAIPDQALTALDEADWTRPAQALATVGRALRAETDLA
ncbi:SDR family NAD(P)-dependent oxidoreductase [Nocardia huaxiensis]|uniref:SDR family NAD(P)-dependent oxidoreductase n=1 Tax=Nocardia huaxiensis TaxID=2755382 RepID=A0A7D6Z8F6_9NOCA|nr:SDR family NAD(P)-dependent oxidoreductase [Nocardia huaxiensis]QLY29548.1 SDR family NAD(P)-dependent oxidoreductase [Nocardia huaxiensis]